MQANLENKPEYIAEAQRLLGELRGAWLAIDPEAAARQAQIAAGAALNNGTAGAQRLRAYAA